MLSPICPITSTTRPARVARAQGAGAAFGAHMPAATAQAATAGAADSVAAAGLEALLGAQEHAVESPRDRAARRHGQESLKLLRALQLALLTGEPDAAALDQLANHAGALPPADDPRLAALQRAISQRVAVELARRGHASERFP